MFPLFNSIFLTHRKRKIAITFPFPNRFPISNHCNTCVCGKFNLKPNLYTDFDKMVSRLYKISLENSYKQFNMGYKNSLHDSRSNNALIAYYRKYSFVLV